MPIHRHSFWYYIGGMALFLFGLQILTGILLLFYYRPSAEGAYESRCRECYDPSEGKQERLEV